MDTGIIIQLFTCSLSFQISAFNPGYGFTATALILSAITILRETDSLPGKGGVYTPGAAFQKTSLFSELNRHGMKFEILSGSKSKL